jgi:hypothetical protein
VSILGLTKYAASHVGPHTSPCPHSSLQQPSTSLTHYLWLPAPSCHFILKLFIFSFLLHITVMMTNFEVITHMTAAPLAIPVVPTFSKPFQMTVEKIEFVSRFVWFFSEH